MLEEVCDQQYQGLEARQIGGDMPRQLRRPILGPQPSDDKASQQHALLSQWRGGKLGDENRPVPIR